MSKEINITLTKEEWSMVNTWIQYAGGKQFERVSREWFTELLSFVKPLYMSLHFSDDFSAMNIPHDSEHTLTFNRKYLKFLVFSVGMIAYDFDCKTMTTKIAYDILKKLEEQSDESWKQNRF